MPYLNLSDVLVLYYDIWPSSNKDSPWLLLLHPYLVDCSWTHAFVKQAEINENFNCVTMDSRFHGQTQAEVTPHADYHTIAADVAMAMQMLHLPPVRPSLRWWRSKVLTNCFQHSSGPCHLNQRLYVGRGVEPSCNLSRQSFESIPLWTMPRGVVRPLSFITCPQKNLFSIDTFLVISGPIWRPRLNWGLVTDLWYDMGEWKLCSAQSRFNPLFRSASNALLIPLIKTTGMRSESYVAPASFCVSYNILQCDISWRASFDHLVTQSISSDRVNIRHIIAQIKHSDWYLSTSSTHPQKAWLRSNTLASRKTTIYHIKRKSIS